jgi:hypothetical protein
MPIIAIAISLLASYFLGQDAASHSTFPIGTDIANAHFITVCSEPP